MGGYGSGRPATRQGVEETKRFPVRYAALALRQLRAGERPAEGYAQAAGVVNWSSYGRPSGSAGYHVVERAPGRPLLVLTYTLGEREEVRDLLELVERPSNLPDSPGRVVLVRCACGRLARTLYLCERRGRFRCRRCVGVVYRSSRESDRRVSDALAGNLSRLHASERGPGLGDFAGYSPGRLIVLLKAAERIASVHGAAGRPWSAARRAAQRRRG